MSAAAQYEILHILQSSFKPPAPAPCSASTFSVPTRVQCSKAPCQVVCASSTKLPAKATQSPQLLPAVVSWQGWCAPGAPVGRGMTRARGMHAKHNSFFWDSIPIVSPREAYEIHHGSLRDPLLAARGLPALAGVLLQRAQHRTGPGSGASLTTSLPGSGCPQDLASRHHPWK